MNGNKLVINPDKTHLMVMGSKGMAAKRSQVSMVAGTFTIEATETEKLLGGVINQSLKWNQHLNDHESSLLKQNKWSEENMSQCHLYYKAYGC